MTALAGWQNFYVIIGSSAGALIGLQFVVLSLIANRRASPSDADAGSPFATPKFISDQCSPSRVLSRLPGTKSCWGQYLGALWGSAASST